MELLSLPPEILQEIVKETVTNLSPYCAVGLRLVSKVFSTVTIRAIFTTRLLQKYLTLYTPRHTVSLMCVPLVAEYLAARTLADATNTNSLISVIRQTSDALLTEDEKGKQDVWRTYVHALCQAASKNMGFHPVIKSLDTVPGEEPIQEAKLQDILAAAVYLGQISKVKDLINLASDATGWSQYFGGLIPLAAREGHEQILIMLLEHGTNVSYRHFSIQNTPWNALNVQVLRTALEMASLAGHNQIVRLLQKSKHINTFGIHHERALINAAHEGHSSTVQILLEQLTAFDRTFIYEQMLVNASAGGHVDIVQMILDLGAKVNPESIHKPINYAARLGRHEVIELLLTRGAKQVGSYGHLPSPLCEASRRGFIQATQVLLDHGANINDSCPSPLIQAARCGQEHIVQLLIDRGVDLSFENSGARALQAAAGEGHESVVRVLVEAGIDVNGFWDGYHNPLIHAITRGQVLMARYLVKLGASRVEPSKSNYAQDYVYFLDDDEHMAAWQRLDPSLFAEMYV